MYQVIQGKWWELSNKTGQVRIGIMFRNAFIPINEYSTTFYNDSNPDELMIGPTISTTWGTNIDVDSISAKYPRQMTRMSGPVTYSSYALEPGSDTNPYILDLGWIDFLTYTIEQFARSIGNQFGSNSITNIAPGFDCSYKIEKIS